MYIGFYNYYKGYNQNKMFLNPSSLIGDNLMYPFFCLNQYAEKMGHQVATIDTDNLENFDTVVFIEFPGTNNKYLRQLINSDFKNIYLIIFESPAVKPDNLNLKNHKYFKKIFCWDDNLIDNIKYFKINYGHKISKTIDTESPRQKLCTLISGNKSVRHPAELYTERINAIRWFEKNYPNDFDLYGMGWDHYNFYGEFLGIKLARLNRLKFLTKLLATKYSSYKGAVNSKKETYKNYKFSICYENVRGFNGYITEKIFDCFFAGCIPIYLGAPNIETHVPKDTFIDKRNFTTYEDLYKYLKNMSKEEYSNCLNAIKNFLKSEKAHSFSAEYFAETIIKEITS